MRTTVVDGMRPCPRCGLRLPNTEEHFHRGGGTLCKPCARARASEHYRANHARSMVIQAEYRKAHPQTYEYGLRYRQANAARRQLQQRLWRLAYAEYLRAWHHNYYRAHLEIHRRHIEAWRARNPDKVRAHVLRKNHRRRGVEPDATARQYIRVLKADPCSYCGVFPAAIEIDHIAPVCSGGTGDVMNLTASCRTCNNAKGRKSLLSFLIERSKAA